MKNHIIELYLKSSFFQSKLTPFEKQQLINGEFEVIEAGSGYYTIVFDQFTS